MPIYKNEDSCYSIGNWIRSSRCQTGGWRRQDFDGRKQPGILLSGEKGNRCESCTNSSLYLGSEGTDVTGKPGRRPERWTISQETCLTAVRELAVPGHEKLVVRRIFFVIPLCLLQRVSFGIVSLPVFGLIPCLKNTIDGVRDEKEKCNISG